MVLLIILGVIAAIIALILLLPIGADIGYEQGKLHVLAKAGPLTLKLFPRRKREEPDVPKPPKKKKQKKPKAEKPAEEQPKEKKSLDITLDEILALLKAVLDGIAHFGGKIRVDRFVLHVVVASGDPYNSAMLYGKLNAWLSALMPLCKKLNAKNCDVWTDVNFLDDWPQVDFAVAMSFRIGQLFGMGFRIGFGALKVLLQRRRRRKLAARMLNAAETEKNEQENQDEERMAANG